VTVGAERVDVAVENGPAAPMTPVAEPGPGAGWGLDGLRRRVGLLGGGCEHTPTAEGGYAVRASLPLTAPAEQTSRTVRGPS
jgi:signal transduction histidine kinase